MPLSLLNDSILQAWEKKSSIRSRPRRVLVLDKQSRYLFPINEQPLCIHPLVIALGDEARCYILIQSAYKFMGDITLIETDVVNTAANKLINDKLPITFPLEIRHKLLTVVIDEAYHAYVALDFMQQIEKATGITPVEPIRETGLSRAIKLKSIDIPSRQREFFELIAVCIGENSITKELVKITKDDRVNKFFNEVNADHALDEGRHCGIFALILTYLWNNITQKDKDIISTVIPEFIHEYLKPDLQRNYNRKILAALSIPPADIDRVINDTHIDYTIENFRLINPVVDNINHLFKKAGVFSHQKMLDSFQEKGLL